MVGALVLAAGRSTRFGSDKRLARLDGSASLLVRTLEKYASVFDETVVVLRPDDVVEELLPRQLIESVSVARPPREGPGMGDSIAAGIESALDWNCACVALGDMPWIKQSTLEHLARSWVAIEDTTSAVLYPTCSSKDGHPVFFDKTLFPALRRLSGDSGAAHVKHSARKKIAVGVQEMGVLLDVDRPSDLAPKMTEK